MSKQYYITLALLMTPNILLCATAAVHSHGVDNTERESDGAYRPRDYEHYNDAGHNVEFDHEAILGSVREAEEYDSLSPEEAKRRFALLLPEMDLNDDSYVDHSELKKWILHSFKKLSQEEAEERMSEVDINQDGLVTWSEYLKDAFGVSSEDELDSEDIGDTGMLVHEERAMWRAADADRDGALGLLEFAVFSNPEEHESMHGFLVNQTIREKDLDGDGLISFNEYIGDKGAVQDHEWVAAERDKFEHDLDRDGDGQLARDELKRWLVPDDDEIAEEETEHLLSTADDDGDGRLSFAELLRHHQVFVGGGAEHHRLDDEL